MEDLKIEAEEQEIAEEADTVVIYNKPARQYLIKLPIRIARLMGFKGGEKLKFKAFRKGPEKKLEVFLDG